MSLGDIPSIDAALRDASHPVYLVFTGNTPGITKVPPGKIENYASEVFGKITELLQKTKDHEKVSDLLKLAEAVHLQTGAGTEYAKLQELGANILQGPPPSPRLSPTSSSSMPRIRNTIAAKRVIVTITNNLASSLQFFGIDETDPKLADTQYQFQNLLTFYPGFNFKDARKFNECKNDFFEWKKTYIVFCEKVQTLKSAPPEQKLDKEIKELEELANQIREAFTSLFIKFIRFATNDESIHDIDQATQISEEKLLSYQEKEDNPGGIHADYRMLLLNTKKNSDIAWVNALLQASGAQKGLTTTVPLLVAWFKMAIKNFDQEPIHVRNAITSALNRIGEVEPDKTLAEFLYKYFAGLEAEVKYPLQKELTVSPEMQGAFNALNSDEALSNWMAKVKANFSKNKGWGSKEDFHLLKELAVLIYCLELSGSSKTVKEAKALAGDVVAYYLAHELGTKYQQ